MHDDFTMIAAETISETLCPAQRLDELPRHMINRD